MTTPTTFTTICANTKNFPKVTIMVTKTKVLDVPARMGIQTKIGGICPLCNQIHTSIITDNSNNKYAPIYPENQREFVVPTTAEFTDPQRKDAL
jgi:hypothetical protein